MNAIKIQDKFIGKNYPPFIVAEAGINHNGEIEKALEMISVAKKSGVNAIKFQTFKAEEFISNPNLTYSYFSQGKEIIESQIDLFKRCEFTKNQWIEIKKKCDDEKIIFFSTPENISDLNLLMDLGIPIIKVASDGITNLETLKEFSLTKIPIILSSGMSTLDEVNDALDAIGTHSGYPTILLVTTSEYPTPINDVNLRRFETFRTLFPSLQLGLSDHTRGHLASSLSCALGAVFFEKHFTLSNELPGPDHWFSENPDSLTKWVRSIHDSFTMLGSSEIKPVNNENDMRLVSRKSICAIKTINEGDKLDETNIGIRRPGDGLPPKLIKKLYGAKAKKMIMKGSVIKNDDYKIENF